MKLIIDIPENTYNAVIGDEWIDSEYIYNIINSIKNGTPLDKIRTEIKDIAFDWQEIDGEHESFMVVDLNDVLEIIDKYRGENE